VVHHRHNPTRSSGPTLPALRPAFSEQISRAGGCVWRDPQGAGPSAHWPELYQPMLRGAAYFLLLMLAEIIDPTRIAYKTPWDPGPAKLSVMGEGSRRGAASPLAGAGHVPFKVSSMPVFHQTGRDVIPGMSARPCTAWPRYSIIGDHPICKMRRSPPVFDPIAPGQDGGIAKKSSLGSHGL